MNKPEAAALRLPDLAQLDPTTRERIEQAGARYLQPA
jgi:hypothetical protein